MAQDSLLKSHELYREHLQSLLVDRKGLEGIHGDEDFPRVSIYIIDQEALARVFEHARLVEMEKRAVIGSIAASWICCKNVGILQVKSCFSAVWFEYSQTVAALLYIHNFPRHEQRCLVSVLKQNAKKWMQVAASNYFSMSFMGII
eukprot:6179407-Pleurochrysis_carterae.AAC.3